MLNYTGSKVHRKVSVLPDFYAYLRKEPVHVTYEEYTLLFSTVPYTLTN